MALCSAVARSVAVVAPIRPICEQLVRLRLRLYFARVHLSGSHREHLE